MKGFLLTALLLAAAGAGHAFAQDAADSIAVIETGHGNIAIEFFAEDAPKHVENFLGLASAGSYDGTLFHRIIPGFMIQGGDPNTIDGDPATWGQGGPDERVEAEFNTIKHNRGIVSMARSADPNSAGSQFFIVHQNSNFLDGQYTVFGRIVTDESYATLDSIAATETGAQDKPLEPESVRITSVSVVDRASISDILDQGMPERMSDMPTPPTTPPTSTEPPTEIDEATGNQKYVSEELGVSMSFPAGWLLQSPPKTVEGTPDIVAVRPATGGLNAQIALTVLDTDGQSFTEIIAAKDADFQRIVDEGLMTVTSNEQKVINGLDAYEVVASGHFVTNGQQIDIQLKEIVFYGPEKYHTLVYVNSPAGYDEQLAEFDTSVDTFRILGEGETMEGGPSDSETGTSEGGGCLIATATFGSEMAPQVQQLRELRDNTIMQTASGAAFMAGFNEVYYSFSPTVADLERQSPAFKELVRLSITPMLSTLPIMEHAETEAEVLGYGIGVIMLNAGMYLGAPAVAIVAARRIQTRP